MGNNKLRIIFGVVIFILALTGGSLFIKRGINITEETKVEIQENTNEENIKELETEKEKLIPEENKLKAELNTEFKANKFSEKYYTIESELEKITDRITEIEFEISKIKNGYYDNEAYINEGVGKGIFFIVPGIVICVMGLMILVFFVRSSNMLTSFSPLSMFNNKSMLEDMSNIAVKMAKDLNPTYEEFKCPNCGASLDPTHTETKECEYCGTKLFRTVKKDK